MEKFKKILSVALVALVVNVSNSIAQEVAASGPGCSYKKNNNFDAEIGAASGQFLGALSWTHLHGIGKKEKFKIGYGIRFNSQFGNDLTYITAPAKLTSGKTGPSVFFAEQIPSNIDTLTLAKSQNNSLNAHITLQYTFGSKFDLGFTIDAVGFSFGASQNGNYITSKAIYINNQSAKPTSFNALLISDNDIGMLNSALYARYWLNNKWAVKLGASFLFTEYTTANKLRLDNNRFRNKALFISAGVTFKPFN